MPLVLSVAVQPLAMPDYLLIFVIGLTGSAHCIGMCGGFMIAVSGSGADSRRRPYGRQVLYLAGKTLTYVILGAVAGLAGAAISGTFTAAQDVLSWAVGLTLIAIGLSLCGVVERVPGLERIIRLTRLQRWVTGLLGRGSGPALFGLGVVNGLLPCGLVYAMVAIAAASGSVVQGSLIMATFGMATFPALLALSLTHRVMPVRWRVSVNRVGGVLILLLGLLTVVRGTPLQDQVMHHVHHHSEAPASGQPNTEAMMPMGTGRSVDQPSHPNAGGHH